MGPLHVHAATGAIVVDIVLVRKLAKSTRYLPSRRKCPITTIVITATVLT